MNKNQWKFIGLYVAYLIVTILMFRTLDGFDDIFVLINYYTIRMMIPLTTIFGIVSYIVFKKWWIGGLLGVVGSASVLYVLFQQFVSLPQVLAVSSFGLVGSGMAFLIWKFIFRKAWK